MADVARQENDAGRSDRLPALLRANSISRTRYEPLVWVFAAAAFGMIFDRYGRSPAAEGWLQSASTKTVFALWWAGAACSLGAWFAVWRVGRNTVARNTIAACLLLA